MKSRQYRCFKIVFFSLLVPLLLAACKAGVIMPEPLSPLVGIEKILVVPFKEVATVY